MYKIYLLITLLGVLSSNLLSQPINMIEREIRFNIDSLEARQKRGDEDNYIQHEKYNSIQIDGNEEISEISGREVESEVHSAMNPKDTNNIIISPIFQDEFSSRPSLYCTVYYTKDGGKIWKKSNFQTPTYNYNNTAILGGGDPVLVFDYNGRAYITWIYMFQHGSRLHSAMYWAYSDNGGETWQKPQDPFIYEYSTSQNNTKFKLADKQWLAVNKNNDVFVSYTLIESNETTQSTEIYVKKLNSGTEKFGEEKLVSKLQNGIKQFSTITVDNKQNIHIMYAELKENGRLYLHHSQSKDGGDNFTLSNYISEISMPKSIFNQTGSADTVIGITSRRLYPAPMIIAEKSDIAERQNNLYAVWNANGISKNERRKMDIYFSRSTDNGNHWSVPKVLSRELNDRYVSQYYPSIAVNQNGVIAVSYYDRNNDVNFDANSHYVIQYSYDGGISFTSPKEITTMSTNFQEIGFNNSGFGIGEYNSLILTENYALPVWADGREGNGNVNIYAAKVGLDTNGIEIIYSLTSENKIIDLIVNNQEKTINLQKLFTNESTYSYIIYGLKGEKLYQTEEKFSEIGVSEDNIDLNFLINGVYFIQLKTEYGYSAAKFIMN